jgi:8-oxo-dGTP pyrophosphatase MutT (NUDIX family)
VSEAALYADAVRIFDGWTGERVEEFRRLLAEQPGATRADNPGAHLTASAIVVHPSLDRVLLCLHGRVGKWLQLGGHCEDEDDTVAAAALREATEESGLPGLRIDPQPIDLDIHPVRCRYGPSLHYDVRFVVLAPDGIEPVVSAESRALGWFAPEALPEPLGDSTRRLVDASLAAIRRKGLPEVRTS